MALKAVYLDDATGELYAQTPSGGTGGFPPTFIEEDTTFVVAENYQVLVATPIKVDGTLTVDGVMVML